MANIAWSEIFLKGRCEYHRFEGSDHQPVLNLFDSNLLRKKKGILRFDRSLREKQEIRALVEDSWSSHPLDSVLTKICRVRTKIVEWTKLLNRNSRELIQSTQEHLEAALSDATPNPDLIDSLQDKLNKAYAEEEQYWRQRSRIQWLGCGDRNSSFFHSVTRGRRAQNKFAVIEDDMGNVFVEERQIVQTVASYYQDIFSSRFVGDVRVVREILTLKVSPEMNQALMALPTDSKIRVAVFSINVDKALGPDGFSAGFYQSFWDIIGADISN